MYIDSYDAYHSAFVEFRLKNPHKVNTFLRGNCSGVTNLSNDKFTYGEFEMGINCNGIMNLLSIPKLEKYGYHITYDTLEDWIVHIPEGVQFKFMISTILCNRMPYIDMRDHSEAFTMVQTV